MDRFNAQPDDNQQNNNGDNPWINNQDPSIDKTEENDKVQREEPNDSATSETADNKNPFEANDTTELPQVEPEKTKKHTVRNIIIGGVAIVAAATFATSIINKPSNNSQAEPAATSQEQSTYEEDASINNKSIYSFDDGLSADEVKDNYLTVQGYIEPIPAADYINDWMKEGQKDSKSYYSNTVNVSKVNGLDVTTGSALFNIYDSDDPQFSVGMLVYELSDDGATFDIRVSINGGYYMSDEAYHLTADAIPTAEEAAKIAENELINNEAPEYH